MKAVRIHRFGPTEDVLQVDEVPVPEPGPGQVLVKVEAASLNRMDLGLRTGANRKPEDLPITPGGEVAGTIAALGSGVTGLRVGQRIVAHCGNGYAEYTVSPADKVFPIPDGVDAASASTVPVVYLTAWCGLVDECGLKSGDRLLVQAGGSGVGMAAIQIGKHIGAEVYVTAGSDEKCARCKELGADEAINYNKQDFVPEVMRLTGGRGVDIVLELVGGDVYAKSLSVLAPGGQLISIGRAGGAVSDPPPPPPEGRTAKRFSLGVYLGAHPEGYRYLDTTLKLLAEGKWKVVIDSTYPLAEAKAAQRRLEGREHFGKIVLTP